MGEEQKPEIGMAIVGSIKTNTRRFQVWMTLDVGETFIYIGNYVDKEKADRVVTVLQGWVQNGSLTERPDLDALLEEVRLKPEYPDEKITAEMKKIIRNQIKSAMENELSPTPAYVKSLEYFRSYREESRQLAKQLAQQNIRDIAGRKNAGNDTANIEMCLRLIASDRRLASMDTCPVVYLEPSAIAMIRSVFYADAKNTEMPDGPVWLQPLAPIKIREEYVCGVFLFNPYNANEMSKSYYNEFALDIAYEQRHFWFIEIASQAFENAGKDGVYFRSGMAALVINYDAEGDEWQLNRQWQTDHCPSKKCFTETLGAAQVLIPCSDCQEELTYWARWIKTALDVRAGKFRKLDDTGGDTWSTETITSNDPPRNKGDKAHKTRTTKTYDVQVVSYDASYFKQSATRKGTGSPLEQDHIILSTEEAINEGALELDMEGVLICYRRKTKAHRRTIKGKGGVDTTFDVKAANNRRYYITLAHWQAIQKSKAPPRTIEDIHASEYER